MNTAIEYLYRDAANYKTHHRIIAAGEESPEAFFSALHEGDFFLPHDAGLPELQPDEWGPDDHIWHELVSVTPTTEPPDLPVTAADLAARFRVCGERGWDETGACRRHGLL